MTTFQHIGTARHRGVENTMNVMLYGRQHDGVSIAIEVRNVEAYGFIKTEMLRTKQIALNEWVRWVTSMQRSDRGCAKYEKENDAKKPNDEILNYWKWCHDTSKISGSDIVWKQVSGFNIRHVQDKPPPVVWKFIVKRYDVWRALLSIFKNPVTIYERIRTFRTKMKSHSTDPLIGMPGVIRFNSAEIYETMFKPEIVWMVDNQLPACSWMTVAVQGHSSPKKTSCAIEVWTTTTGVTPCESPPIPMAPFRVSSYDIEAMPFLNPITNECEFPDPVRDCITTIGVASFNMLDAIMIQTVFMFEPEGQPTCVKLSPLKPELKSDAYDPSTTTVYAFTDEFEMLRAFSDFIREYDPDIITGYNVLNFDNVYLLQRVEALCPQHEGDFCSYCSGVRTFSRIDRPSTLKKKYTHTNQRGGQETWEAWIEGRDWMDLYRVVMTDHKLRSYKLDNVCLELLGTKKIHIAYEDIPKHQKTPTGREFLAQYCVKDAWLPCQIMIKRCKLVNAIQMSQVTGVPLTSILHRGQQIRTLTLMLQFVKARCRKQPDHPRYFLPDESANKPPPIEGFEGAVVITPKPGFYQTPVITLDFASLYPSIMRAYNMCFSTLVPTLCEAKRLKLKWSSETHNIKDPKDENYPEVRPVRSFEYPEGGAFEYVSSEKDVCFVTTTKRVGILPEILEQLLSERKRIKKLRKQFGEKTMDYAVLDGRQLALKVCANSVYGFTGAGMGYLGEKRIASSVTRVGRGMANHTKYMCEEKYKEYGLEIVYGDSVIGSTPLLLRVHGKIVVRRIETLATEWSAYHNGKESCELKNVESWTDNGWTPVKRVIRHACTKKLVQVQTHTGNVVCTTDHSLVRSNGTEVAPKDICVGDELMHNCPSVFPSVEHKWEVSINKKLYGTNNKMYDTLKEAAIDLKCHVGSVTRKCVWKFSKRVVLYTPKFARLLGMFIGDGSCGQYKSKSGKKSSWAINNANKQMLKEYKNIANNIFPEFQWKILPTLKSSGVYKLVPKSSKYGNIARFVSFWRKICYNVKREKKIDDCVLQSSEKHRQLFWKGLNDADGTKGTKEAEISQKGSEISLSIVILLRSLGYENVVVDTRPDKPNIFRMRARHKTRKTPYGVRKITNWKRQELFVYDLTTENHHFHAGVGTLIVHNTDSVFANIPPSMCDTNCSREELIQKVDKIGTEMGNFCTQAFLPPNDLEYEKFYYPILLKGKKRYAGHKFEPGLAPKLDVKGFECIRRDFAPIVSKTQKEVLVRLCKHNDIQGAINYAREMVVKLMENKVPIEDLTMSKKLTRKPEDYKNPAPHTELAKRLQATQPAHIAPKPGDRIDFIIRPGYKGEKTCMRAVTPDDVREGKAMADTRWYLDHQLEQPLRRIFEMVMENASSVFAINSVTQVTTISNPMMRSFVHKIQPIKKRNSSSQSQINFKKKKKPKKERTIESFFN